MVKECILYPNLEAELSRAGIPKSELARLIGKSRNTIYSKLSGKTEITLNEARIICAYMEKQTGRAMTIKYLFNIM